MTTALTGLMAEMIRERTLAVVLTLVAGAVMGAVITYLLLVLRREAHGSHARRQAALPRNPQARSSGSGRHAITPMPPYKSDGWR